MLRKIFLVIIAIYFVTINAKSQVIESLHDSRDGRTYKVIKIGNQTWMGEDLRYGMINGCKDTIHGNIYTYAETKNVCPAGWHVPSLAEWEDLFVYLGGFRFELDLKSKNRLSYSAGEIGGKLKEAGTIHWKGANIGATNSSGFTALPYSPLTKLGQEHADWWTSSVRFINKDTTWTQDLLNLVVSINNEISNRNTKLNGENSGLYNEDMWFASFIRLNKSSTTLIVKEQSIPNPATSDDLENNKKVRCIKNAH